MIKRILHISDTHGHHRQLEDLPEADVLVHTGDVTQNGTEEELLDFLEWFQGLPYRHKLFIAGNHDTCLHGTTLEGLESNCHYLDGTSIEIEGIRFFGIPMLPEEILSGRYEKMIQNIPEGTDVLLSHEPPYGILDMEDYPGNVPLLSQVRKIRPRYHLFGHVHDAYGKEQNRYTEFFNSSLTDRHCQLCNRPVLLEYVSDSK